MPLMMDLTGIAGDSIIADHVGWLTLTGFSWGGTRPLLRQTTRTGHVVTRVAQPQLRSATVRRKADSQSAQIWMMMVGKAEIPRVTMEWLRTGETAPICYFSLEFAGVRIARMGEASAGDHPIESIDLLYRTVTLGVRDVSSSLNGGQDIVTYSVPTTMGR